MEATQKPVITKLKMKKKIGKTEKVEMNKESTVD